MRSILTRVLAPLAVGLVTFAVPAGAGSPSKDTLLQPDKVVICTLNDVKGKTSPCGCHIPKGGLARQASFLDGVRVEYGQVYFADAGGYFPEDDVHRDASWFLMDAYTLLGMDAVGVGERDLRFGLAYLRENARARKLPVVCANLLDRRTGKPVFATSTIVTKGHAKVGFFGLISDKGDLGPARDSLTAGEPEAAARAMVAQLRKQGATVVVALSNIGKIESEDLCVAVEGIDVVIAARGVPVIQRGRVIKNTLAVYGGEQGQNMARTLLTLAPGGRSVAAREADVIPLSPEVLDQPEVLRRVRAFEDALNGRLRKAEKEQAAQQALAAAENSPDRYVGVAVCERCHSSETAQWRTTAHARAWQTLVDEKKDADPACTRCHVVGFQQPGGFQTATLSPAMTNVQCEVCHGMGTKHEAFRSPMPRVTEATCRQCHDATTSPAFSFDVYRPHIVHTPMASLPALPRKPGMKKSMGAATTH